MIKSKWLERAFHYSLFMLAFSLPLPYIFGSGAAILMGLLWVLTTSFKLTFKNLQKRKTLWVWMIFFVLHIFGYFYSENKADASWDLQSKFCFLLFPIIIGAGIDISQKYLEAIFLFFYCRCHMCRLFLHRPGYNYLFARPYHQPVFL